MKASTFSEAQKAFILKQGSDGGAVAEICRKAGISQATYFNWKKKYDGLRRLKQLEEKNAKLKKLVADLSLDKLAESASSSMRFVGRSRSARLVRPSGSIDRPNYKSRRSGHAALEARIKEICHVRVRYGYRRVHVLLGREGWRHGQNRPVASIVNWACNCAINRRSGGSRPSCATAASRRRGRTRPGPWTFFMTSWQLVASSGCSRSSIFLPLLARVGAAAHFPRHRCCGGAGKRLQRSGLPGDDPRRRRQRVPVA
ncbi:Transposase [Bradyrhizobium shewense]|uniref:Transposase n=1 Tax=Bradyrhizobium shewense TaxID=1761772 RepID=A0A1C3XU78_9BRAD|nr:Transposase [Bradyrhizobium shewense]